MLLYSDGLSSNAVILVLIGYSGKKIQVSKDRNEFSLLVSITSSSFFITNLVELNNFKILGLNNLKIPDH